MNLSDPQRYVQRVLDLYRDTPGTSGRVRTADRRLANSLYQRGIPLSTVRGALLLTVSRRTFRSSPDAEPLPTIRSLHYFQHVIRELINTPLPDGYYTYLCWKLAPLPKSFAAPDDHQIP